MSASPPRPGWLFAYDWARLALDHLESRARMGRFDRAGFDLFTFPSNVALIDFDLEQFAARQAARGRRRGWRAVLSHHEQFGALAAALVAEKLRLPGATPESILAAQHKLHARRALQRVAPEANLGFFELCASYGERIPEGLHYPVFVKPVKAAFSVLARCVANREELQQLTRFSRRELWVIRHLLLNMALSFRNWWPTPGILPDYRIAPEFVAVWVLLSIAVACRAAPSTRVLGALSGGYLLLVIGRYADVTVPALFGRSFNLYWDGQQIPRLLWVSAGDYPWWVSAGAIVAAVALLAFLYVRCGGR